MSTYHLSGNDLYNRGEEETPVVVAELVPEPPEAEAPPPSFPRRRVWLPLGLFLATCVSTFLAGILTAEASGGWTHAVLHGLIYGSSLMTILVCHEAGHFVQARRYGVYASYPYFIPMPLTPIGTLGAVIAMGSRIRDRRSLFDIGIAGPLAGLVPTLIFSVLGLYLSRVVPVRGELGDPLFFKLVASWFFGPLPPGHDIWLHPMAFAGWVGLLITALNLIPIGQLDGGHVLYAMLRGRANEIASMLLVTAGVAVVYFGLWNWIPMLFLLALIGPFHPPTANDDVPLGWGRVILGWLTLAFIFVGFTPTPFVIGR